MPARSGGRYELRDGKPVLVERTGYKPEAEAKPQVKPQAQSQSNAPKRARKEVKRDADA